MLWEICLKEFDTFGRCLVYKLTEHLLVQEVTWMGTRAAKSIFSCLLLNRVRLQIIWTVQ